jgi:hypothetical protein
MKHLKVYEEFNSENEGLKSWGAGIMAGLSLFANAAMGGDIKTQGSGKSMDMSIAIKKAESDAKSKAIQQIAGATNSYSAQVKDGQFGEPKITKDKDGNYIVTIDYSVDSTNIDVKKKDQSQIMNNENTKRFLKDILDMGFTNTDNKDINKFIDKYSNDYDFKISKMTEKEANEVGEMSIKLSKKFSNGNIVYCVVTPIGK